MRQRVFDFCQFAISIWWWTCKQNFILSYCWNENTASKIKYYTIFSTTDGIYLTIKREKMMMGNHLSDCRRGKFVRLFVCIAQTFKLHKDRACACNFSVQLELFNYFQLMCAKAKIFLCMSFWAFWVPIQVYLK